MLGRRLMGYSGETRCDSGRSCTAAGAELEAAIADVKDASELARVGALIIDCDSGQDFLVRVRRR